MASEDEPADPQADQRYWAFISYSQKDAAWARRLHARLERYRIPRSLVGRQASNHVVPRRLVPIFRDRSELASAADLAQEIRDALQRSSSLIVVCSPHSAACRLDELHLCTSLLAERAMMTTVENEELEAEARARCSSDASHFLGRR